MKLYFTKRSPYARKVRIIAREKGLIDRIAEVEVNLQQKPAELVTVNPLGKIPTLVRDDGISLFDSPVIAEYLNKLAPEPKLLPKSGKARFKIKRLEALGDGLSDVAVEYVHEMLRPEDKRMPESMAKYRAQMEHVLAWLDKNTRALNGVNIGTIAVASALGYITFRLTQMEWKPGYPALARWFAEFDRRPSMQATQPMM